MHRRACLGVSVLNVIFFNAKALRQVDVSSRRDGKYICQARDVVDMLMKRAFSRRTRMSNCEPENIAGLFSASSLEFLLDPPQTLQNLVTCQP